MEELVRQNRQDMAKIVGMLEKAAKDKDKKIESLQKQLKESGAEADEEVKERQVELVKLRRQLEVERQEAKKVRVQADSFRVANNFLETRVGLLERTLEQEQRQGDGLRHELESARGMVVHLERDLERLEGAFLSLQRKYQAKADQLDRRDVYRVT